MPSFQDSAVIFLIALLLFGPKKLPELARYIGKLMNEFRRASNEFRIQMEDEFRQSEQAEQQKKIAAMEAAAPKAAAIAAEIPDPEHPHLRPENAGDDGRMPIEIAAVNDGSIGAEEVPIHTPHIPDEPSTLAIEPATPPAVAPAPEPLPIASNGDLHLMPPASGLPVSRSSSAPAPEPFNHEPEHETQAHG